jgi:hypothetical protein
MIFAESSLFGSGHALLAMIKHAVALSTLTQKKRSKNNILFLIMSEATYLYAL